MLLSSCRFLLIFATHCDELYGGHMLTYHRQMGKAGTFNLPAKAYVLNYAVPNFFFHLQTAYAILRSQGVPLGKMDYLKSFMA